MAKKAATKKNTTKRKVSGRRGSAGRKKSAPKTEVRGVVGIAVLCLGLLALVCQFVPSDGGFLNQCMLLVRGLGGTLCLLLPLGFLLLLCLLLSDLVKLLGLIFQHLHLLVGIHRDALPVCRFRVQRIAHLLIRFKCLGQRRHIPVNPVFLG